MSDIKIDTSGLKPLIRKIDPANDKMVSDLTVQVATDTMPFVPKLNGDLRLQTRVVKSQIIYPGPYARYLYEGYKMVDAATGKPAFYIEGVGFRFPKNSKLRPTSEKLSYTEAGTGDHWFEKSKDKNLKKWERVAEKEFLHGVKR